MRVKILTMPPECARYLQLVAGMRVVLFLLFLSACSRIEPLVKPDEACHRTDVLEPAFLPQRVEWVDAGGKANERLNSLWCETVGPALFDPTPAPPADTAKAITDSVAVISWNTHVGGGEVRVQGVLTQPIYVLVDRSDRFGLAHAC